MCRHFARFPVGKTIFMDKKKRVTERRFVLDYVDNKLVLVEEMRCIVYVDGKEEEKWVAMFFYDALESADVL